MKYPFPQTTKAQRRILDQIGAGNASLEGVFAKRHIIDTLLACGFIRQCGEKEVCNDHFGRVTVPEYEMPTDWHMLWCEYQSVVFMEGVA